MTQRKKRTREAPEALDLPTPRAVRLVARWLADEVEAARERLRASDDEHAVHDVRVALRRLRSWVRAWRRVLRGAKPRWSRRVLGELAALAAPLRDREVQRALLESLGPELAPRERPGMRLLATRLADEPEARARLADAMDERWATVRPRLLDLWSVFDARVRLDGHSADPRLSESIAEAVHRHASELEAALLEIEQGPESAHAARIAGKRLRYLLEPIGGQEPAVAPILKRLRGLQDELGSINDLAVLADSAEDALDDAAEAPVGDGDVVPSTAARASRPRDPRPGLEAIATLARQRAREHTERLARDWSRERMASLLSALDRLTSKLRGRAAADVEIERKYLLRTLPPAVKTAPVVEMAQGYIPGRTLVERLRRVRGPDGERWYRTVKAGRGMTRAEFEEETTREIFEAMWPLTEGRRVAKRRYAVREGDVTWEIDDFIDRTLVLAEIELDSEEQEVPLPDWLAPHVVREVTGEGTYQNSVLAK
ncbi:MAG TPA: CHAD domain-containing protein [Gemmatimonadaceae bacterium]|nr:CHAD domain-containing protein [Gemmatimonadaceae bacterium]